MDEISINFDASEKNIGLNQHLDYNGNNIDVKILKESDSDNDDNFADNSPQYNQGIADIGLDLLANNKKTIKQNDNNRPDEDNSAIDIVNNNIEDNINNNELQKKLRDLDKESESDYKNYNEDKYYKNENNLNKDYESSDRQKNDIESLSENKQRYSESDNDNYNNNNNYDENKNYYEDEKKYEPSIEEILREKQELLLQFDRLTKRGIKISREYTLASNIDEMRFEYNRIKTSREVDNSIIFSRKMLMAAVTCLEFCNNRFDPFDINLDGWSENIHENINEYDDVFEQLYEKYKNKAEVAPEIKLMMMLAGSAFMYHLTSNIFKSSMPQFENVMRKNPNIIPNMNSNNQQDSSMGSKQNGGIDISKIMGMMGGLGGLMGNMGGNDSMPNISPSQNIQPPQSRPETSVRPDKLHNMNEPLPNKSPELNKEGELTGPKALGIETLLKSLGSDSLASESAGGSRKKSRGRKNKGNGMSL